MDSEDVQGCQHWGLSAKQKQQEKFGRQLRRVALFDTAEATSAVIGSAREELGEESVETCVRLGNSNGKVALHMAAWRGNVEVVRLLLEHRARVDAMTIRGQTAMHFAAGKKRDEVVSLLLDRSAKMKVKTVKGETPVGLASRMGVSMTILERMEEAEAKEEGEWVDFQHEIKSRPARREKMAEMGTIIFSTGMSEEDVEEGCEGGESGSRMTEEGAEEGAGEQGANLVICLVEQRGADAMKLLFAMAWTCMANGPQSTFMVAGKLVDVLVEAAREHGGRAVLGGLIAMTRSFKPPSRNLRRQYKVTSSALPLSLKVLFQGDVHEDLKLESETERLLQSAKTSLRGAVEERGGSSILNQLCRCPDVDLGFTVAVSISVCPARLDEDREKVWLREEDKSDLFDFFRRTQNYQAAVKVARKLGIEEVLVSAGLIRAIVESRMWQLVEQLGDAKEEVRQAVYEEVKGARCWRKAVALLKRWELTDVKSDFLLECATLELLMSKGLKSDAWEYVGEKEELVRVMEETYQVKRPQGSTTSEVKSEETLSLPGSVDIVWVDTLNELGKCRRFLEAMGAGEILGIDTEWRYPRPCSLVQLAIQDTVYLLDCVKAEEDLEFGSSLGNLLGWIFSRECQLRRVGFAFTGDVENLQAAFPTLREMEVCVEDCQELASRSLGEQEEAEAAGWTPLTLSLSSLCRRIWGKRLDKSEQCSNWDRRPLRSSQTIYAALDAHVLLGIHRHFQHLILEKKRADERE